MKKKVHVDKKKINKGNDKKKKKDFLATAHFHTLNTMGWVSNKKRRQ